MSTLLMCIGKLFRVSEMYEKGGGGGGGGSKLT